MTVSILSSRGKSESCVGNAVIREGGVSQSSQVEASLKVGVTTNLNGPAASQSSQVEASLKAESYRNVPRPIQQGLNPLKSRQV